MKINIHVTNNGPNFSFIIERIVTICNNPKVQIHDHEIYIDKNQYPSPVSAYVAARKADTQNLPFILGYVRNGKPLIAKRY